MNLFAGEVVTAPSHLPISVSDEQAALAAAVVEEVERLVLQRAVVDQTRRITIDGPLPTRLEFEPTTAITSLTRWTPGDPAVVVDESTYNSVSRDPVGTFIQPAHGYDWPAPERSIGSFALTYMAGWEVTDTTNAVPLSIQLMVSRAVEFRKGAGLGDLGLGSLKIDVADSYKTDQLPREIASIGRAYAYRPGIIAARP